MNTYTAFCAGLFALSLASVQAAPALTANGAQTLNVTIQEADIPVRQKADLSLNVAGKLWSVMGEPVLACTGTWQLKSLQIGDRLLGVQEVPSSVWQQVHVWDVSVQWTLLSDQFRGFPGEFRHKVKACDLGVMQAPGSEKPSFNVPGSPSWSSILTGIEADDAKALLQNPQANNRLSEVQIVSARLDLSPVLAWLEGMSEEQRTQRQTNLNSRLDSVPGSFDALFSQVEEQTSIRTDIQRSEQMMALANQQQKSRLAKSTKLQQDPCYPLNDNGREGQPLDQYLQQQSREAADCLGLGASDIYAARDHNGRWGFKNNKDRWMIPPQYLAVGQFADGIVPVQVESRQWGYIDTRGRWVVSPQLHFANNMYNGSAAVIFADGVVREVGIIDRNGAVLYRGRGKIVSHLNRSGQRTGYEIYEQIRGDYSRCRGSQGSVIGMYRVQTADFQGQKYGPTTIKPGATEETCR